MPSDPSNIDSIFLAAVELPPTDRGAYLDSACGDDQTLRERLERLLAAHVQANSFLESPAPELGATIVHPAPESAGTRVGPYQLVKSLGQGGMGAVYLAEQREPVKRRVALKIIKPGMDTRQVIARFEAERQALAMMDHPNIARVFDAGMTVGGHPYFVMELVDGVSITQYCDRERLTPRERLELFLPVCQAVQHAHQKGVIHRDLKPSNILVTLYDGRAVPKVIDFGVAKAISQASVEKTTFTQDGQIVGTPEYMSPEQAQSHALIDTRSDVYSLGVVLYELLTGDTPLDRQRLRSSAWDEIMRVIREEEPPKPSTKLSSSNALPSVAAHRSIEPARLGALVRGELDWIVMKALDKDRARRYESPSALARDIENHLHDQPVLAGPPSSSYRFRKFAHRHQRTLAMLAAIVLTMMGGTAASLYQAVRATRAERLAEARLQEVAVERDAARRAEREAEAAAGQAQRRLKQIERGSELLGRIFEDLDLDEIKEGPDPLEAVLARRLLDAAEQLDGESVGDPLAVAQLQRRLGISLLVFGHFRPAIGLLEKSRAAHAQLLGTHHTDTLDLMTRLARGYDEAGEIRAALELWEETLTLSREHLGLEHPTTLKSMYGLACGYTDAGESLRAVPLLEEVVRLQQAILGDDHVDTMSSVASLALRYLEAGQLDQARSMLEALRQRQEAALGGDNPHTIATLNNVACCYSDAAQYTQAIAMHQEALQRMQARFGVDHPRSLKIQANLALAHGKAGDTAAALAMQESILVDRTRVMGPNHPDTLSGMHNLAVSYRDAGQFDKAIELFEQVVDRRRDKLGADHPDTLNSLNSLAVAYGRAGQWRTAEPMLEETLRMSREKLGPRHPQSLLTMSNLAGCYSDLGRTDEAIGLLEECLELQKAVHGAEHLSTLVSMNGLAGAYTSAGKPDKALSLHEAVHAGILALLGPDHPYAVGSMHDLALAYHDAKQLDRALPLLEETLERSRAQHGERHSVTIVQMNNLASAYCDAGQLDRALPLWERAVDLMQVQLGPEHPFTLRTASNLASGYDQAGQSEKAQLLLRKLLGVQRATLGPEHPNVLKAMNTLGVACQKLGQLAEAIELLDQTVALARTKLGPNHPTTLVYISNLAETYRAAGRLDEAIALHQQTLELLTAQLGPDHPETAGSMASLALSYLDLGRHAEAEKYARECLRIRQETMPDDWRTYNTMTLLGRSLAGQKALADAEPLLLEGYEGMLARAASIPPAGRIRITETLDAIIQLYEDWEKSEEAERWRATRDRLRDREKAAHHRLDAGGSND